MASPVIDDLQPTRQLTFAPHGHILTNINVWSRDSRWIVFDTRSDPAGSCFDGKCIQRVHVDTGRVETLFESSAGVHCGVATVCPATDRVAFILGPDVHPCEPLDSDWRYSAWNRRGVIVDPRRPSILESIDALDFVPPFTPGALRGGSHVHVWSPDGCLVSFTYEDRILQLQGSNEEGDRNQRNVGVTAWGFPVHPAHDHPRNVSSNGFSAIVTRTWNEPEPGSDQIQKAYEDAWIGSNGYQRSDGTWQHRALAFLGDCVSTRGQLMTELFVVDIPEPPWFPGDGPLEGTIHRRPTPPKGCLTRRLTRTEDRAYPGIQGPRHWPRSSPDGRYIATLMRDEQGLVQLHLVSNPCGSIQQLTHLPFSIESAFSWRPDGEEIAFIADGSVMTVDVLRGDCRRWTSKLNQTDSSQIFSPPRGEGVIFSPDGRRIAYVVPRLSDGAWWNQVHITGDC